MSADRLPYRARWEQELRAGVAGQDRQRPSTWRLDGLWRAACLQAEAEDFEQELKIALDHEAPAHTIRAMVSEIEHIRAAAHAAFLAAEREETRDVVA